jgi:hypothetical protein
MIDATKASEHGQPIFKAINRPLRALKLPDAGVRVDPDNQHVAKFPGAL